jgi:AcrR family transcriptional regulator
VAEGGPNHSEGIDLPRLPPGRHGLGRDFVTRNQLDRLTAGVIETVAGEGYADASVTLICAAAGISRRTFYSYFESKEACYLHVFGVVEAHLFEAIAEAAAADPDWPVRARARLGALLQAFDENPDLVRFTLVAPLRAGGRIADRYRQALERILAGLTGDLPDRGGGREPTPPVQQALLGGVVALIVKQAEKEAGRGGLTALLPELSELFLGPYIGMAEAARVAREA